MQVDRSIPEVLVERLSMPDEWMMDAECAKPELQWDPMYFNEAPEMIRSACNVCPVVHQCDDVAQQKLESGGKPYGVFGGKIYR